MPSPAEERFIAAATAPLADNAELQMTAEAELRQLFEGREIDAGKWEKTAAILESRKPRKSPWRWLYVATALAVLVAAALVLPDYKRYRGVVVTIQYGGYPGIISTDLEMPGKLGKFTRDERLILFGDLNPGTLRGAARFETPWREHPDDPALLAQFGQATGNARASLPPDFLKEADRLAPRNSVFRLIAASSSARKSISGSRQGPKKPPYAVKDRAAFEETLQLLKEAWQQPDYHSYQEELLARRLAILPAGEDLLGRSFASSLVLDWQAKPLPHAAVGQVIATKAYELTAAGDTEGFRELCAIWEDLVRRILVSSPEDPMEAVHLKKNLLFHTYQLSRNAKQLQLEDLTNRYQLLYKKLSQQEAAQQRAPDGWSGTRGSDTTAGIRWISPPSVEGRPPVSDAELRPGRLAEHAFWSRITAYGIGALMLCIALAFALMRFRHGHQAHRISASLVRALGPADFAWIIGAGVLIPFLLHYGLEYLSPMGGHAWGRDGDRGQLLRSLALAAAVITLSGEIAARRLAACYDWPGKPSHLPPLRWLALVLGLCWLFGGIRGWRQKAGWSSGWEVLVDVILVSFSLIALRGLLVGIFCKRSDALPPLVLCRALPPAFSTAALLAVLASFALHAEEKFWIKRDEFTRFEAGIPTGYRYSAEAAKRARADLLEIFTERP